MFRRGKRTAGTSLDDSFKIYYASDIHGSERCWRKFLAAWRFYGARALIMGGDLTGKAIVPVLQQPDGSRSATFLGERRVAKTDQQLDELVWAIRDNGMYEWIASPEEVSRFRADEALIDSLFEEVMCADLRRWMALADDRLKDANVEVFAMPGNDDSWSCDPILDESALVHACHERVVTVGGHEMISCAYANRTPWNSPRELDENDLYRRIRSLAEQLDSPRTSIFNLHAPPYDSGLDTAPEITADLEIVFEAGQPRQRPCGSTAVRELIEEYQPLLSLHGHIHESRGSVYLGRTLAVNPGSDYNSGRISAVLVGLGNDVVMSHQFVVG